MENINAEFYRSFIAELKEIVPRRGQLCQLVMDILHIEKTSAYRRLRGDVPFTLAEIIEISRQVNISLDNILGVTSPYRQLPFSFFYQDYFNLTEMDYKQSNDYIAAIRVASERDKSEFGAACNLLPLHSLTLYPTIFRFFVLKWMYQFGRQHEIDDFSRVVIPRRLQMIHREYSKAVRDIKQSNFVFHEFSISNVLNDLSYFRDINLLKHDDILIIKNEMSKLIDRIEFLAVNGAYENGNKVDIYISGLNFETSYSYLYADKIYVSMVEAFTLGAISSIELQACEITRKWINSMKRTAISITDSERQRVRFLTRQRELLNRL
jgi:hypothetical protein